MCIKFDPLSKKLTSLHFTLSVPKFFSNSSTQFMKISIGLGRGFLVISANHSGDKMQTPKAACKLFVSVPRSQSFKNF